MRLTRGEFQKDLFAIEELVGYHLKDVKNPDCTLPLPSTLFLHIQDFLRNLYMWLETRQSTNIDVLNPYLDRFFAALASLCATLDDKNLRRYESDLWHYNDMLGENIPWDLLTEDYLFKQAKAIFQHKAFRLQFIAFYTGGAYVHNLGDEKNPDIFVRPRVCCENLLSFLRGWDTLKDRVPVEEVATGGELVQHQEVAPQKSGAYLRIENAELQKSIAQLPPRPQSKEGAREKTPTSTSTKTRQALSEVERATERVRVVELLNDEGASELEAAVKLAQTTALNPSRSAVKGLIVYGERFQSKSSPLWKALGLALLGLALTIAGALTIAVSVGAISTGFFAPPGFGGVVGGVALIEAGVASLSMAVVSLFDDPETETMRTPIACV